MTSPEAFRRPTWNTITRSQLVPPAANERGVSSRDELIRSGLQGDYPDVPVRIYEPVGLSPAEQRPVLLFFHGGGFCIQSERSQQTHSMVLELVARLGFRAVSVGYRLAPESPFPSGLRDAFTVLLGLHIDQAQKTDSASALPHCSDIFLCGDSAGGNLALVLALLALNMVDPDMRTDGRLAGLLGKIKGLLLIYPALFEAPAESAAPEPVYMLPTSSRSFFVNSYLGEREELLQDWRVAPLKAPTLSGLPATAVVSAGLDPLRASNQLLVELLSRANVPVYHKDVENAPHGFLSFPGFATDANRVSSTFAWLETTVTALVGSV